PPRFPERRAFRRQTHGAGGNGQGHDHVQDRHPAPGSPALAERASLPPARARLRLCRAAARRRRRALRATETRAGAVMTPVGRKLRQMREARQCQLKDLAKALKVSSAYLSALEHGHRGKPSPGLVQQVAAYFNLAWEQVDELKALAELSDPRVTID